MPSFKRPCQNHPNSIQSTQNDRDETTHIQQLPPELWVEIAKVLPMQDIITLFQVNRLIGNCAQQVYNRRHQTAQEKLDSFKEQNAQWDHTNSIQSTWMHFVNEGDPYTLLVLAQDTVNNNVSIDCHAILYTIFQTLNNDDQKFVMGTTRGRTMIHIAAAHGDNQMVIELVYRYGIPADIKDNDECTPLWFAIDNNHPNTIELLVHRLGVDINAYCDYRFQETPLQTTTRKGMEDVTKLLLDIGADPNIADNNGYTPLHWAVTHGFDSIVQLLITYHANLNVLCKLGSPLHYAIFYRRHSITEILISSGVDISKSSLDRVTPLQAALDIQDIVAARSLLDAGANAPTNSMYSHTLERLFQFSKLPPNLWMKIIEYLPIEDIINLRRTSYQIGCYARSIFERDLYNSVLSIDLKQMHVDSAYLEYWLIACINNNDAYNLLALAHYSNKNTLMVNSLSLIYRYIRQCPLDTTSRLLKANFGDIGDRYGRTIVHYAAKHGHTNILKEVVGCYGASVNVKDVDGYTPLHYAVCRHNSTITRILINHGADPNAQSKRGGSTPLHKAIQNRCTAAAWLLIKSNADVNQCNNVGESPLHAAIRNQDITIMRVLLARKADINHRDRNGMTPLHLAMRTASCNIWYRATMRPNADFNVQNREGVTPLTLGLKMIRTCHKRNRARILQLILEAAMFVKGSK